MTGPGLKLNEQLMDSSWLVQEKKKQRMESKPSLHLKLAVNSSIDHIFYYFDYLVVRDSLDNSVTNLRAQACH